MNDLLLRALRCEKVPRPPVWLMRQAGRYMPQYQALRVKYSLWEMFHQPEIAAAITCLPLELLGVDAAILFSDILVIAEALGLSIRFFDGQGPRVEPPIQTKTQVGLLTYIPVEESLQYVFETIKAVKKQIDVPLIGFSGGPFTVASYFIDATSRNAFEHIKRWIKEDPRTIHALLAKITEVTIAYLKAQIRSGVDVIQVFDSWANVLNDEEFAVFSLPYLNLIVKALQPSGIPLILFCRSSSLRAELLAALQPGGISFDWHLSMRELRQKVPLPIAVQGNFNPEFLKWPQEQMITQVNELLISMQGQLGFIVNLGHGITPDSPFTNVLSFVEAVKKGVYG
jgi:uroporphyrinogen decarboxylase